MKEPGNEVAERPISKSQDLTADEDWVGLWAWGDQVEQVPGGFHLALITGHFGWNVKSNNAFRNKPPGKCGTPPKFVLFFENSETTAIFGSRSHCLGLGRVPFSATTRKFRVECQQERYISKERGIFRSK